MLYTEAMGIASSMPRRQQPLNSECKEVFLLIESQTAIEMEDLIVGTDVVIAVFSSRKKANKEKEKMEKRGRYCRVSRFVVDEE